MGDWLEPALRFLHYAALLGLFGWTAFRLIGLRGLDWSPRREISTALLGVAVAAPLLSVALMLASIATMMGVAIPALDWSMVEAMIVATSIGAAFLVRLALLIAGLCVLIACPRRSAALPIAALCYAAALMTLGWSGHAAATEGGLGLFHRLNNGVHLLAAGLWLGAIGCFLRLTVAAHRRPDDARAASLLLVMHRFAPLGIGLVLTVAITGLVNAQLIFGLENSGSVWRTDYGALLVVKAMAVGGMIAFGAHHARVGRRRAIRNQNASSADRTILMGLRRSLAGELSIAAGVVGLVAMLGMLSPVPM